MIEYRGGGSFLRVDEETIKHLRRQQPQFLLFALRLVYEAYKRSSLISFWSCHNVTLAAVMFVPLFPSICSLAVCKFTIFTTRCNASAVYTLTYIGDVAFRRRLGDRRCRYISSSHGRRWISDTISISHGRAMGSIGRTVAKRVIRWGRLRREAIARRRDFEVGLDVSLGRRTRRSE